MLRVVILNSAVIGGILEKVSFKRRFVGSEGAVGQVWESDLPSRDETCKSQTQSVQRGSWLVGWGQVRQWEEMRTDWCIQAESVGPPGPS